MAAKRSGFLRAMTGTHSCRGSIRELTREQANEERFLEKSAKKLKKSPWTAVLQKRLEALRGPSPGER